MHSSLGRLLLVVSLAAGLAGCAAAHRTEMLREDELTDAQNAIAQTKINRGDMTIQASVDHPDTTYNPGEPITLSVRTSKDAYVAILRVLPNGDTTIVYPNRAHRDASIAANRPLTTQVPAGKPGIVLFEFVSSTDKKPWLFKREPDNGSDFANLGVSTHNLAKDIVSGLKVGTGPETAATYIIVRVAGRDVF